MSDLVPNLVAQPATRLDVGQIRAASAKFVGVVTDDIEMGEPLGRVVEGDGLAIGTEQVALVPAYDAAGQFADQRSQQAKGEFGPRVGNSDIDFKFAEVLFQDRPFPSVHDVASHLHHVTGGEGRPAARAA